MVEVGEQDPTGTAQLVQQVYAWKSAGLQLRATLTDLDQVLRLEVRLHVDTEEFEAGEVWPIFGHLFKDTI